MYLRADGKSQARPELPKGKASHKAVGEGFFVSFQPKLFLLPFRKAVRKRFELSDLGWA